MSRTSRNFGAGNRLLSHLLIGPLDTLERYDRVVIAPESAASNTLKGVDQVLDILAVSCRCFANRAMDNDHNP